MGSKDSVMGRLLGNTQKFSQERVGQTITMLLEHAHDRDASDIHIEPRERFILVRYRIDGVLRGVHKLPLTAKDPIVLGLKKLAKLNATELDVPQEGQYNTIIKGHSYTVRIATLPVLGGEKVVLRLTAHAANLVSLEELGLWGDNLKKVRTTLTAAHGLILVAGPKRAGKTTTLYSLVHILSTPLDSAATIEDPIEHRLSGISQTQVHPRRGIGFAQGFQAALQQDVNIVMLSNLADKETIELAVHAASGGHLILAGVPANSAPRAILQLKSSGVQPFLLSTALQTVIAQRLVRKLCQDCRQRYELDSEQRDLLDRAFDLRTVSSHRYVHELEQKAVHEKIGVGTQLNTSPSNLTHMWDASSEGCRTCDHTGYQGQVVLTEVIDIRESIRNTLLHQLTIDDLVEAAKANGFIPLPIDGLVKALRGLTTVEELLRILPTD